MGSVVGLPAQTARNFDDYDDKIYLDENILMDREFIVTADSDCDVAYLDLADTGAKTPILAWDEA